MNWARRLKRVFGIEIEQCMRCGGRRKVIASIEELEVAEIAPRYPLHGESLLPVLRGERGVYARTFFWRTRTREGARVGNWKYVKDGDAEHLYDLRVDLGEKNELKARNADVFPHVKGSYDAWAATMLPRRM